MSPEGRRPGVVRKVVGYIADIPSRIRDLRERPALEQARREGEEANRRTEMLAEDTDRTLASEIIFRQRQRDSQ